MVSITVRSTVLDMLAVLDFVGGGAATSLVGTSPARTVTDISPVRATTNTKRFIFESPWFDDATVLVSEMGKTEHEDARNVASLGYED